MKLEAQIWLHVKTQNMYVITSFAIREEDLALLVNYQRADGQSIIWSRPASQFFDGRFQIVP